MIEVSPINQSLENWLVAERQRMAHPDALTSFLADKQAMLESIAMPLDHTDNQGARKSVSHADAAFREARTAAELDGDAQAKRLGIVGAKALKVASGFAMRAGYFLPNDNDLYRERMVELRSRTGESLPVLGAEIATLQGDRLLPESIDDLMDVAADGIRRVGEVNTNLRELLFEHRRDDAEFDGSLDAYTQALNASFELRGLYVVASAGALSLQGAGPNGDGPLILEPRSDGEAEFFLRANSIHLVSGESGIPDAISLHMLGRTT